MTQQLPSISREVHYVLANGQHRPAQVVNAFGNDRPNLVVTIDATNDAKHGPITDPFELVPPEALPFLRSAVSFQVDSVPHDEDTKAIGTWHWPERT